VLVFLFVIEAITGVAMAAVYTPSVAGAWGSLHYLEHQVVLGSLVRGIHYFASSAFIVVVVLHMTQALLYGAHRRPREATWIVGVVLLLALLGFGITGRFLRMDQHGYWDTRVATGVMGSAPGGDILKTLMLGGQRYGSEALTRFYALHVFVLPGVFGLLTALHLAFARRHGPKPRPGAKPAPSQPWWPYQTLRTVVLSGVVLATLIALTLLVGVGLEAPADPASAYEARPDWYFRFLFQLLHYLDGPLALLGTVVLPGLAVVFLIATPFIDRRAPGEGPSKRTLIPYALMLVGVATLTIVSFADDAGNERFQKAMAEADEATATAEQMIALGGIDASGRIPLFEGLELYRDKGCAGCHDGTKTPSPGLAGYGTRQRLEAFLAHPNGEAFFGKTPLDGKMDAVEAEGDARIALVDYLRSLGGHAEGSAASVERGAAAFVEDCTDCHNAPALVAGMKDYAVDAAGPDLAGLYGFEWTRAVVRNAGHVTAYGGSLDKDEAKKAMPSYEELSDEELSRIVTWLLAGAPGAKR
ncbi:MAG: cytochrome b N-terminal domain-containing protein, partial [Myxococcales bacterium]|nr:cytochrome b N-terminal domain-containing protein [Myxococcales bacterium]